MEVRVKRLGAAPLWPVGDKFGRTGPGQGALDTGEGAGLGQQKVAIVGGLRQVEPRKQSVKPLMRFRGRSLQREPGGRGWGGQGGDEVVAGK